MLETQLVRKGGEKRPGDWVTLCCNIRDKKGCLRQVRLRQRFGES